MYCVILDGEKGNSVITKNEKEIVATPMKFFIGGFWGNMIKMNGNICFHDNDKISCSDITWRGNEVRFYRNDEVIAEY